jgi:hypothetical protein
MSAISIGSSPVLCFARSVLRIARRHWRERESGNFHRAGAEICSDRAANCSGGARISAEMLWGAPAEQSWISGDIDRTIVGAGICSIGAENSAPALAGARIGQLYRAGAEICSVRAASCSGGARISAEMLRGAPAEQRSMSATSIGSSEQRGAQATFVLVMVSSSRHPSAEATTSP